MIVLTDGETFDGGRGTREHLRVCEGACPIHGIALERTEDFGWCPECEVGYSADMERITIHGTPQSGDCVVYVTGPTAYIENTTIMRHGAGSDCVVKDDYVRAIGWASYGSSRDVGTPDA